MRGYSLVELMAATAIIATVFAIAGGIGASLGGADRHTKAYVEDVNGLRRAVRMLERDIRAGGDLAAYALKDGVLTRGERIVARNIATFQVAHEGGLVTARLGPGQRRDVAAPERPVIRVRARAR